MQQPEKVAIFWDYENLLPNTNLTGYEIVENIRSVAHTFGSVILLKAYVEIPLAALPRSTSLRSELQASGVSLTDCPHDGRKDVASKMLIVDMIAFAIDNPAPATIVLISGDRDYAYAVSILRLRKYRVVVICPANSHASLMAQASVHVDWNAEVLGQAGIPEAPIPPANPRPQTRAGSTASRPFTPRASNPQDLELEDDQELDDDDDIYVPYPPESNPYSARMNGFGDKHASSRFGFSPDLTGSWRQTAAPSRATSKPQSPPISFRSAKSSPPSPPIESQTPERTFVTASNGIFDGSRKASLPTGFQYSEPEPITLKPQAASEPPAARSPWLPGGASASPVATSAHLPSAPTFKFTLPVSEASSMPKPPPSESPSVPPPMSPMPAATAVPAPAPSTPPPTRQATLSSPARLTEPEPAPTPAPTPTPTPVLAPMPVTVPLPPPPPAKTASTVISDPPRLQSSQAPPPPKTPVPAGPSASSAQSQPHAMLPPHFRPLLEVLENRRRSKGQARVSRSEVGTDLTKYPGVYKRAGVNNFAKFIALAEKAALVECGTSGYESWIALRPEWSGSTTFPAAT
ncbi:hypothetical protein Hypma_008807 [Hypsizygus marmoreus]|uniref:NYN domain-containing protein n=1 Tax=Hypsizygus marmoreus TaxID=39966 RepID=A0A369JY07_HYPMA|nr:hypothetical protein Hypma_008807 [Hypsizygus marmoreus]